MKKFQKVISAVTAAVMSCSMAAIGSVFSSTANAADKTAIEIVNDMGLGWNLGNTFDSAGVSNWVSSDYWTVNSTETGWGNPITTKAMIDAVHASGFNSIRIPVTWFENADKTTYDIDDAYLARIKEVVDYAYANDMYVILNMHWDCSGGTGVYWLDEGLNALPQYKTMWTEIANYFKDYDNHLVLESMNEVPFDYETLNTLNQTFVDIVRSSGSGNADRLLLLAGANDDLAKTCNPDYVLPDDDMLAVSVHYYYPSQWAVATSDASWGHQETWGTDDDKQTVYDNFAKMTAYYVSKGVPVILGEYGVDTTVDHYDNEGKFVAGGNKDTDDIVEYLDIVASSALASDGISAFLWDASNSGSMEYFDRENLTWYDSRIGDLYKKLSVNGPSVTLDYDIQTSGGDGNTATVELSGTFKTKEYEIDLSPYAGKDVTITQVILNGTPGVGCGVHFTAVNPDGSNRDWTSEAAAVGEDGTVTIDIDGVYDASDQKTGESWTEEYQITMGSMGIANWWGPEDGELSSVTLVFDKAISYSATTATVTATPRDNNQPIPTDDTTEPSSEEQPTETTTEEETTEPTGEEPSTEPSSEEQPTETTEAPSGDITKYGDANLDGSLDIMDVILVNKAIFGKADLSEQALKNVDFNKNNVPESHEVLAMMKVIIKLIDESELANFNS